MNQDFLNRIAKCALAAEKATGFPARVTVAQACAESSWGARQTGDFNVFGLTRAVARERHQKLIPTHERLTFAGIELLPADERATITSKVEVSPGVYDVGLSRYFPSFPDLQAATDCYVRLITTGPRYAKAWMHWRDVAKDVNALIEGIAAAGYATGKGYAALVKQIAGQANVTKALDEAREG